MVSSQIGSFIGVFLFRFFIPPPSAFHGQPQTGSLMGVLLFQLQTGSIMGVLQFPLLSFSS